MIQPLLDYYRIPQELFRPIPATAFGFSQCLQNVCYGGCNSGLAAESAESANSNALNQVRRAGFQPSFDPAEVIENLRFERYRQESTGGFRRFARSQRVLDLYYVIRDFLPFSVRKRLQRIYFRDWKELPFPAWPVDFTVDNLHKELLRLSLEANGTKRMPFIWFWPEGASGCLILTHDVETAAGLEFTFSLMDLDESYGFKASYQVIPEKRYELPDAYVCGVRSRGCEFNIHDINHDGRLYSERSVFVGRAAKINGYARRYNAQGFRAGVMYRRQDWYDAFKFSYDMSVPNVAHLEPLRGGCCTVMPFFIGKILELPLTTAQDYSLFHILSDYSIGLWKQQLALIRGNNGLMSFLTHPDYLIERSARKVYESLLDYLRQFIVREEIWSALPGDVDRWWRARAQMKLVACGDGWEIVGPNKERARLAYATIHNGRLVYELPKVPTLEKLSS